MGFDIFVVPCYCGVLIVVWSLPVTARDPARGRRTKVQSPISADTNACLPFWRDCRHAVATAGLTLAVVVLGGCVVTESKYKAALAESEEIKAELERTQTQTSALELQIKSIKDQTDKLTTEAAASSAELQQLQGSRDAEREDMEEHIKQLEQEVAKLSTHHRSLRQEHAVVNKENESLKATVARYQKELKDRAQAPAVASKPAAKAGSEMLASKPQEALSGPLASVKPSPAKEGVADAKPPAPSADKEPKPVEEPAGFWAIIKRWLLNLWHLIF